MRRRFAAYPLLVALLAMTTLVSDQGTASAAVQTPGRFTSVSARPGPGVGEITISWQQDGSATTAYRLETALTSFSKTDPDQPTTGRRHSVFTIARTQRSFTLSAAQAATAGVPVGAGEALYFRLFAVNKTAAGTATRAYPYLQTVRPRPVSPQASGTAFRAATFNVRTAKATTDDRPWLVRAPDVAAEILSRNPGVVAIQELSPGRADGQSGSTTGTLRQTTSLEAAMADAGASRYRLVRTTPYVKPGTTTGSQGARILYDTSRYGLVTRCPESSSDGNYSPSCSIRLPILSSDGESRRRRAAYAEFRDRRTGERFFYVSVHFDERHSSTRSTEVAYDALRGRQSATVADHLASINVNKIPVIFAGDTNSWQKSLVGNTANEVLVSRGYYDTAATAQRVNIQYGTVNHFDLTVYPNKLGVGARLDVIKMLGIRGAVRTENVLKPTDSERPSDHNLIVSDIVM